MDDVHNDLKEWKDQLKELKEKLESELKEIQECKAEIAQMRIEAAEKYACGKYIRDENRIILSAPEIVIGNVDQRGLLKGGGSRVILRSEEVQLEGMEKIAQRAPKIHSIAECPGTDGNENTVLTHKSEIVQVGRNILLNGITQTEAICPEIDMVPQPGVLIASDSKIEVNASLSAETEEKDLDQVIADLETKKEQEKANLDAIDSNVDTLLSGIQLTLMKPVTLVTKSDLLTRAGYLDLDELQRIFGIQAEKAYTLLAGYYQQLSIVAQINLRINALKKRKDAVSERKATFKDETTSANILLQSETIMMESRDGDNNVRTNEEAGLFVNAPQTIISSQNDDLSTIENSSLVLRSETIELNTQNTSMTDQEKGEGEAKAEGTVKILSKEIQMTAIDHELKEHEPTEKALTAESKIFMRAETIQVDSTDTEGKATGLIDLNAKNVRLKSMDVDKESRAEQEMAKESQLQLLANKMFIGSPKKDDIQAEKLLIGSKIVQIKSPSYTEIHQEDGGAQSLIRLSDGNLEVAGSGDNTLYGNYEFKGKATLVDIETTNINTSTLEVSDGLKTPNTKEGMPGNNSKPSDELPDAYQDDWEEPSFE